MAGAEHRETEPPQIRCGSFQAEDVGPEGAVSYTAVRVTSFGRRTNCATARGLTESFFDQEEEIIAHEANPVEITYSLGRWPEWLCKVQMPLKSHDNQGSCQRKFRGRAYFYFGKV